LIQSGQRKRPEKKAREKGQRKSDPQRMPPENSIQGRIEKSPVEPEAW
jgi:hypothetical protein